MKTSVTIFFVAALACCTLQIDAWSTISNSDLFSSPPPYRTSSHFDDEQGDVDSIIKRSKDNDKISNGDLYKTRRRFLNSSALIVCFFGIATAPTIAATTDGPATVYISGKQPQVPGAKPPDKSNFKGTRKDPDFLRSIADCRNQCQNSASGPNGLAKSKEDCLSECQDICCRTYEQCTFNIVPRI
jgi:hypothetical protein